MSQPTDRTCHLPQLGKLDRAAGELWVSNPFLLPQVGKNLSAYERNQLYMSIKGRAFLNCSFASAADLTSDSRGVIPADFNGDNLPDLLVASVGGGPLKLLKNQFPQGNRVTIQLEGAQSNYPAIGTRVILECGGQKITRDVFPANGFMGQAPPRLRIGIGDAKKIDQLTIRWPTGKKDVFKDVTIQKPLRIREGNRVIETLK